MQLVAVDPRLEPEDVGPVSDCRVDELASLAGEAGARHLDLALARGLDRAEDADDLLVARQARQPNLLLVLDARPARNMAGRVRRGRPCQPDRGHQAHDHERRQPSLDAQAPPPIGRMRLARACAGFYCHRRPPRTELAPGRRTSGVPARVSAAGGSRGPATAGRCGWERAGPSSAEVRREEDDRLRALVAGEVHVVGGTWRTSLPARRGSASSMLVVVEGQRPGDHHVDVLRRVGMPAERCPGRRHDPLCDHLDRALRAQLHAGAVGEGRLLLQAAIELAARGLGGDTAGRGAERTPGRDRTGDDGEYAAACASSVRGSFS